MATVPLRLRGVTPLHVGAAAVAASPLGFAAFQVLVRHARLSWPLLGVAAAAALLPWLSRAAARASYRAKCDDVAVHVRGEALPYKTITAVRVERTARRATLYLQRGETVTLELVLWDAFAGRLEPIAELEHRLEASGHPIPR
ncbi:MAG TPA: hypothetical protein VFF06_35345 [Polyangia bacterium]|nr:hypothetical protein [Polyangia bacterium]